MLSGDFEDWKEGHCTCGYYKIRRNSAPHAECNIFRLSVLLHFAIFVSMSDTPENQDVTIAGLRGIGISAPYASQLVSGERTPSLKLALRIKRELGVPVEYWDRTDEAAA